MVRRAKNSTAGISSRSPRHRMAASSSSARARPTRHCTPRSPRLILLACRQPHLLLASLQFLFGTGGPGLPATLGPDTRITNVNTLPPGPFQMTGPTMPYDAYTGDTIHQFFQMYQQMDCAIDSEHVSRGNPTGCLHDLQSAITTTFAPPPGGPPHDTGQTMA